MLRKDIETYLLNIKQTDIERYLLYWDTITPKEHWEYYKRWIFSFLSVHCTWQKNVDSYLLLDKENWAEDKSKLSELIIRSGCGLHNIRTTGIWNFHYSFWENPTEWYRQNNEDWFDFRDRVMDKVFGLGLAKTSFALELSFPRECGVVCADTHILQLYGHPKGAHITDSKYREIERHWTRTCKKFNIPSPIARHIYWDTKQQKTDTKYWSYVFETTI
jgi:hypothetical protein